MGTRGRAWPSGLQGGHETSREGTRIHSRERCPGAQGAGGREPDAPQHLTPRGQAPRCLGTASPDPEQGQRPCVSSREEGRLHQVGFVIATPYQPRVACSPFLDIVLVNTKLCLSSHSLLF